MIKSVFKAILKRENIQFIFMIQIFIKILYHILAGKNARTNKSVTTCCLSSISSRTCVYLKEFLYPGTMPAYQKTVLIPSVTPTLRMVKFKTRNKHKALQSIIIA